MSLELFQWESTWLSAEREGLLQEGTRAPLSLALGPLLAQTAEGQPCVSASMQPVSAWEVCSWQTA